MRKTKWSAKALFLAAVLVGLFCLTGAASAAGAYPDMEGHWARDAVERWSDSGILKGYDDGNFHPGDPVTRAQLSEILYRVWGCEPKIGHSYADLPTNAWYYEGLSTMNAYGIALGHGDYIYPEEQLTREEAFYMVAKAFDLGLDLPGRNMSEKNPYAGDWNEVEPSFRYRLSVLFSRKALHGAPDGNFHPKDHVTRAEVMTVIDNLFDVCLDKPGEYTLAQTQVALVTSPGVTVNYTLAGHDSGADVYVMKRASQSGVTFHAPEDISVVDIYGVSSGEKAFGGNKGFMLRDNTRNLSDPQQVPDLSFAGGCGVERDPYRIATGEQFLRITEQPDWVDGRSQSYFYELANDVTLPDLKKSMDPELQVIYLDGKGHTVTYHMEGEIGKDDFWWSNLGLFGRAKGEISNLNVDGSVDVVLAVTTSQSRVALTFGGLVGSLSKGSVVNCQSRMDIKVHCDDEAVGAVYVGGLAGEVREGSVIGCTAAGAVSVSTNNEAMDLAAGGLVGVTTQDTYIQTRPGVVSAPPAAERQTVIRDCGSTAVVAATGGKQSYCGGILGLQSYNPTQEAAVDDPAAYALVENCWSTATVSASGASFQSDCGGVVGQNCAGTVRSCWAQPVITISGTYIFKNQGGICGAVYDGNGRTIALIENCWAEVSNCPSSPEDGHYGGIVARVSNCAVSNCFVLGTDGYAPENAITYASWTSGTVTGCADFTGTTQSQREAFYTSCGWDFETVWDNAGNYPILRGCDAEAQRAAQMAAGKKEKVLL